MKKQYIVSVLFALSIVGYNLFATPAEQLQTIDGRQRNRITPSSSSGGGGGGGGDVGTSSNNVFTATNTFNGPTTTSNLTVNGRLLVNGATTNAGPTTTSNLTVLGFLNVLGVMTNQSTVTSLASSTNTFNAQTFTSNLTVSGRIGLNTNNTAGDVGVFRNPPGGTATYFTLQDDGATPEAGFQFGNINGNYMLIDSDGASPPNLRIEMAGGTIGNMNFRGGTVNMMVLNSSSALNSYGASASWAHTFNGGTFTLAQHANFNSGVMILPTSVSGNSTNGVVKGVYLGSLQATNVTATLPATLLSTISIEAGSTNFTWLNAAIPAQTPFLMSTMTNSPITGRVWTQGETYTNALAQRAHLTVTWDMAAGARVGIWRTFGGKTYITGIQENNDIVATEASSAAMLNAGEIFVLTNLVGTSTVNGDNTLWTGL